VSPSIGNPGNYEVKSAGGGLSFGVPITEFDRITLGANFEHNTIALYDDSPLAFEQFVQEYGNSTNTPLFSVGWNKDTRDSALNPTRGYFSRLSSTAGVSSLRYYMLSAQYQHFFPVGQNYTLAFNALFDYGDVYSSDNAFPVIKNVFAGGIGTVRGYEGNSLGPKDPRTGTFLGGSRRVVGNVQFFFPLPGIERDRTLRLFVFGDAGQVFGTGAGNSSDSINFNDLRYSTGFGLSWMSPVGPLQLVYAKALNPKEGDRTQVFQFQIGTTF
jgi:outer membrane protein insertion porin family